MWPIKQFLSFSWRGISDDLYTDRKGKVLTSEYEGVVVRSPDGKAFGVFTAGHSLPGIKKA